MADNDAQLELKKRARRRLIGAIALVLGAAVFLPMVMDSEPRSTGNDLQIRIPSQEGSAYTSRLVTAPANQSGSKAAAPAPAVVVPVDPEGPVSAPRTVAPVAVVTPGEKAPAEKASSSKSSKAAETVKPETSESRARALLETGTEPAPTASPQRFFIQFGVYQDAANVKAAVARLKQAGIVPSVEKIGEKTRVRAGPFKTHQSADQALAKAKKAGLSGTVVGK